MQQLRNSNGIGNETAAETAEVAQGHDSHERSTAESSCSIRSLSFSSLLPGPVGMKGMEA